MRSARARASDAKRGRAAAVLAGVVALVAAVAAGSVGAMVEGDPAAPEVSSIVVAPRGASASLTSSGGKTDGTDGVVRLAPGAAGGDITVYLALEGFEAGVAHIAVRHAADDGPIVFATSTGATPSTGAACTQLLPPEGEATPAAPTSDAAALEALAAGCVQQVVGVVPVPLVLPSRLPPGRYSLCAAFEAAGRWRRPICRALELLPVRAFALDLEGPVDFGGALEAGVRSAVDGDLVPGNGNGTIVNAGNVPFAVGVTFGRMRSTGAGLERTIAGEFDARVVAQEGATARVEGLVVPPGGSDVQAVLGGVCVQPGAAARVDIGLTPGGPLDRGRYEGFVTFGAVSSAGCVAPPFVWDLVVAPRTGPFSVASTAPTPVPTPVPTRTPTAMPTAAPTAPPTPLPSATPPVVPAPALEVTPTASSTAAPLPSVTAVPTVPAPVAPTPTATEVGLPPSPTPTPTPASIATGTPTATPSATATPTEVPTPSPTAPAPTPTVVPPEPSAAPGSSSGGAP